MGMYIKQQDGTLLKIAGHSIVADGNVSEVRRGVITPSSAIATGSSEHISVVFSVPMTDTNYDVLFTETTGLAPGAQVSNVTNKTANGFECDIFNGGGTSVTPSFSYAALKFIPIEDYAELTTKVNSPDTAPTENSMNLVTSHGIWEAIKNASAVWKGTEAEWTAETEKMSFDVAILTDKHLILAVDRTTGTTTEQASLNKIFHGTQAEWNTLTQQGQDYYDIAHIKESAYVSNPGTLIVDHDRVIETTDWVPDTTYSDFGYKAEIQIPGITSDYSPDVRMKYDDIKNGTISPVADTENDKVIIYASEVPATDITIPVIICTLMSV